MPSLKKATIERVYAPSTAQLENEDDRVWFDLKSSLLLSDYAIFTEQSDQTKQAIMLLEKVIVDWNLNLEGEPDTKLPITFKNIDEFAGQNIGDFKFLSEWVSEHIAKSMEGFSNSEKKTLSSVSIPVTEDSSPPII